jgi:hypothetical protein
MSFPRFSPIRVHNEESCASSPSPPTMSKL